MKTIFLGKNCIEVDKTDSTNSFLADLVSAQEKGFEGTIVVARHQEKGRGQRGASWESDPGKNLTLSILLHPNFLNPDEQFQLNKAVSLGVAEFITSPLIPLSPRREDALPIELPLGRVGEVSIKWPNDIYIGDKKVAGILIENSVSGSKLQQSIIGIGINVNQEKFSPELPNPVSLKLITGKEYDLKECLAELCSCIEKRYLQLRSPHPNLLPLGEGAIDRDYLKNIYRFDEWANYRYKGEGLKAKITGIAKTGKLVLETEKGTILECDFKEVEFVK